MRSRGEMDRRPTISSPNRRIVRVATPASWKRHSSRPIAEFLVFKPRRRTNDTRTRQTAAHSVYGHDEERKRTYEESHPRNPGRQEELQAGFKVHDGA